MASVNLKALAPVWKIALPWFIESTVAPFLNRILHVPQDHLADACAYATDAARTLDPNAAEVTPALFRAVEATQQAILKSGIAARAAIK